MPNSARVWQRVVFALCLVGLFGVAESAWATYNLQGDAFGGPPYGPVTSAPFLDTFVSIVPGSVADRSGIRPGDVIDLGMMTPAERYWERNELLAGKPIRLPIVRRGAMRWIAVTPEPYTHIPFWAKSQRPFNWAFWLGSALSLFIAALLMWRRPGSPEVRTLALALINVGETFFPINGWLTPWASLDVALNVAAQFAFSAGIALLAAYALVRPSVSRAARAAYRTPANATNRGGGACFSDRLYFTGWHIRNVWIS